MESTARRDYFLQHLSPARQLPTFSQPHRLREYQVNSDSNERDGVKTLIMSRYYLMYLLYARM